MGSKVDVSVVIPVFNVEEYLKECLESVLRQEQVNIEVILIDDGSTDDSGRMVDEYARIDSRVVAIHQENLGVGNARNKGIMLAHGTYIAFMDPDDLYPSSLTLSHLYEAAANAQSNIAGGKLWAFVNGDTIANGREYSVHTCFPHFGNVNYRDFQSPYAFYCYIYKRDFLINNKLLFPSLKRFQDPPFFVSAMLHAGHFIAIDEKVYCYRSGRGKVDWFANNAERANDYLTGCVYLLDIAQSKGLRRLAGIVSDDVATFFKKVQISRKHIRRDLFEKLLSYLDFIPLKKRVRLQRKLGIGFWGFCENIFSSMKVKESHVSR